MENQLATEPKVKKTTIELCFECGADVLVYPCFHKRGRKKFFCTKDCRDMWYEVNHKIGQWCIKHAQCKDKYETWKKGNKIHRRKIALAYYYRNRAREDFREKRKQYWLKNKEKQKEYAKRYYTNVIKKDPIRHKKILEKDREYNRKRRDRIRNNPVKYAEHLKYQREYYRLRMLKKHAQPIK